MKEASPLWTETWNSTRNLLSATLAVPRARSVAAIVRETILLVGSVSGSKRS